LIKKALKALAAKMLRSAGFEVAIAADGFEALKISSEFEPSVVLLDIGLPDIDGFEVARRLRADAKFESVILVAFSAYGSEESRARAKESGFDHFVVKPVSFAELLSVLVEGRRVDPPPADRDNGG
jgi:DNA-binding response OmpR family regulator